MPDNERRDIARALIYRLRLMFTENGRQQYTKDEIANILDNIAMEISGERLLKEDNL